MKKVLLLIFITSISLTGCLKREPSKLKFKELSTSIRESALIRGEATLSYASLKKYILKPKCMSCHSGSDAKPENDPIDFTTYETAMVKRFVPLLIKGKPERSRLFLTVESGEMPVEGELHQKELEFINRWIEACAPKSSTDVIPTKCPSQTDDDDWGDDDDFDDDDFDDDDFDDDDFDDDDFEDDDIEVVIEKDGVNVKLTTNNNIQNYSCQRHSDSNPFECHITNHITQEKT